MLAAPFARLRHPSTPGIVLALFVGSLLVRAVFLVVATGVDTPLEGDEPDYHGIARSFLETGEWRAPSGDLSGRPPLVSFVLWLAYLVAEPSSAVARWTMVFLSSACAPLLFLVGRRFLGGNWLAALLAAVAWSVYPPAVWYATRPGTETAIALLTVAGLGAFIWAGRRDALWIAGLAGVIWALGALTRPVFLAAPFAILGTQLVLARVGACEWRWGWKAWVVGLAAFVLVLTPWTVRNYVEHGVFMPTTTQFGWLMLMSNGTLEDEAIQAGGYFKNPDLVARRAQETTEVGREAVGRQVAFEELRRNWRLLPRPVLNRAKSFWTWRPDPYDPSWTANDTIMIAIWVPTLALFIGGSYIRSWRRYWPALALILLAFVMTLPFWGTPRFRFPVDPLIAMGAGLGLVEFIGFIQRRGLFRSNAALQAPPARRLQ